MNYSFGKSISFNMISILTLSKPRRCFALYSPFSFDLSVLPITGFIIVFMCPQIVPNREAGMADPENITRLQREILVSCKLDLVCV